MLEKAANPTAKVAHAMNGQLFGRQVPQPGQKNAYRACLNGLLAAGLASNWWLNWGAMKPEELAAVNEPAQRIGPVLGAMTCADHDVAVLWSFTEVSMREKQMAAREAHKKTGEQIKLMVAAMPENAVRRSGEIDINAYSISGDYRDSVLTAHYALARAGYPAQIVHESLLPRGILKKYRTLVIVGQTFDLPRDVVQAIDAFAAAGGKIVVDRSCTVAFPHPIVAQADLKGVMYRWVAPFVEKPENFKTPRDASYYQTNRFMTEAVRGAVAPLRTAMRQTDSRARAESDSNELLFERHVGGDGQLFLVANGYEKLPEIAGSDTYFIYNCAPYSATFRLRRACRSLRRLRHPRDRLVADRPDCRSRGPDPRRFPGGGNEAVSRRAACAGRVGRFRRGGPKRNRPPRRPAGPQIALAAERGDQESRRRRDLPCMAIDDCRRLL